MKKQKKLLKLLNELSQPLDYLAWKFRLNSEHKEDTIQELKLMIIKDYKRNKESRTKKVGWWFLRCKWHLLNRLKKHMKNPLANSISIDSFFSKESED